MGIGVNKVLGYALTDVEYSDMDLVDARVNRSSPLLGYEDDGDASLGSFVKFLEERYQDRFSLDAKLLKSDPRFQKESPSSAVVYDAEYGLGNVLLVRPLTMPEWARRSDTIDWVTESYLSPASQENWVEELPRGPYPFGDVLMDVRNGEPFRHEAVDLWRRLRNPEVRASLPDSALDVLAGEMGFSSDEEASLLLAPQVPDVVRDLVEWGELFTDELVWTSLRPVLYTFWS